MILITVGTQLPFDRLIRDMDEVAQKLPHHRFFAQIGEGHYLPEHFEYDHTLKPATFESLYRDADVIVSHAGIGTILTAQKHSKPVIIYPRMLKHGEHRNDHQLATCENLQSYKGIYVAHDAQTLYEHLIRTDLKPPHLDDIEERRQTFIDNLRQQISTLA